MVVRRIGWMVFVCVTTQAFPWGSLVAEDGDRRGGSVAVGSSVNPLQDTVQPLLQRYCFDCHGDNEPEAETSLSQLVRNEMGRGERAMWQRVWDVLHTQQMPPGEAIPTPAERRQLEAAVGELLSDGVHGEFSRSGSVVLRRLNRVEYNNTVHDLFGIYRRTTSSGGTQYDPQRGMPAQVRIVEHRDIRQTVVPLPPDDIGYGFTNIGEVLSLPPYLLEKYLAAARHVVEQFVSGGEARSRRRPGESAVPPDPSTSTRQFVEQFNRRVRSGSSASKEPREKAREFIANFGRRAFRRPLSEVELERYLVLYDSASQQVEPFEIALKAPMQAMLVSPNFLFRAEHGISSELADGQMPLSDNELATRLSYFLWSTMPDEELFHLADMEQLHDPEVLEAQARRMLRHRFSKELGEQFGMQWLQIGGIRSAMPFPDLYPEFYQMKYLPEVMQQEALLLFETILIEDRSVLDFIDPGFSWLNGTLIEFYGLDLEDASGGSRLFWNRYELSDKRRGGILTMGGPLLATSLATRTSPVNRGKWVLETLLGAPPPPPPDNVPSLEDTPVVEAQLSLRERLERHSADPACSSCHRRMDPLGAGLENYDAIGAWRELDGGLPVASGGSLGSNAEFQGPVELKELLVTRYREDFLYCLTEKMLTFALGRKLEPIDTPAVAEIVERLQQNDHRISELVVGIVRSEPFRFMRVAGTPDQENAE